MAFWLKEAVVATLSAGPFTDGSGARLGSLNIIRGNILLSKNGAAYGTISGIATAYPDRAGNYFVGLDATDLNTRGPLRIDFNVSTALPVWENIMVVPTQAWDALFGGDRLQVDVRELGDANLAFTTQQQTNIRDNVGTVTRVLSIGSIGAGILAPDQTAVRIGTVTFVADGLLGTVSRVLSVGSLAAGIVGTVIHATSVGSLSGIGATAQNDIADAVLSRDVDNVEVAAPIHSLATAILKAISRIRDNNGTLETYMTNGTTIKMSQTITTDANNQPIDELTAGA